MEVLLREVDHCVGLVAAYDHATGIDELHDAWYEGACGSWAGRVRIVTQHELAGVQLNDGNGVRFLDRTGAGDRRIKVRRLGCWQEVERGGRPGDGLAGWARRRESGRRLDGRRGGIGRRRRCRPWRRGPHRRRWHRRHRPGGSASARGEEQGCGMWIRIDVAQPSLDPDNPLQIGDEHGGAAVPNHVRERVLQPTGKN